LAQKLQEKKANLNNNYVRSGVNTSKKMGEIKETRRREGVRYAEKCGVKLRKIWGGGGEVLYLDSGEARCKQGSGLECKARSF
jgi:hypothetical protein